MADAHQARRAQPVAPSASSSNNPKEMVLSLSAPIVFGVQGAGVCGRYVPEDPDATLVEPSFAPRLSKVLLEEVSLGRVVAMSDKWPGCRGIVQVRDGVTVR